MYRKNHIKNNLDNICERLLKKNFAEAEKKLVELVENQLPKGDIKTVKIIYDEFNNYFEKWLKKRGVDPTKEEKTLRSEEHDNFLLAHCHDPAAIDDLLYEWKHYLTEEPTEKQRQEVIYHINCYKKQLSN